MTPSFVDVLAGRQDISRVHPYADLDFNFTPAKRIRRVPPLEFVLVRAQRVRRLPALEFSFVRAECVRVLPALEFDFVLPALDRPMTALADGLVCCFDAAAWPTLLVTVVADAAGAGGFWIKERDNASPAGAGMARSLNGSLLLNGAETRLG